MTKQLSRQAQTTALKQDMADRLQVALNDARAAARVAFETHVATCRRDAEGREIGPWGSTYVYVRAPSYRFRMALIEAGVIRDSFQGAWMMNHSAWGVEEHLRAQGQGAICDAAWAVLRRHFPDELFGVGA